eukprot:gene24018-9593_t
MKSVGDRGRGVGRASAASLGQDPSRTPTMASLCASVLPAEAVLPKGGRESVDSRQMGKHTRNRSLSAGAGAVGFSIVAAAALYALSKKKERSPYTLAAWKQAVQEDGSVKDMASILEHVSEKGIDLDAKRAMWPYLLGVFGSNTSAEEKALLLKEFRSSYEEKISFCREREAEIMSYAKQPASQPPPSNPAAGGTDEVPSTSDPALGEAPLGQGGPAEQASTSQPASGAPELCENPLNALSRADLPDELRQFYEAQRIIKNSLTAADAIASWLSAALSDSQIYQKLSAKDEWWSGYWVSALAKYQLDHSTHFGTDQKRQVLRLVNLLSAYAVHDPETGYCQGMSDLAIPFLLLCDDDALAFMCFERLMRKVRKNFAVEDSGIFAQLTCLARLLEQLDPTLFYKIRQMGATDCHFAYRMIVVLMRRELALDQSLRLWEMLWADDLLRTLPSELMISVLHHDAADVDTPNPTPAAGGTHTPGPFVDSPASGHADVGPDWTVAAFSPLKPSLSPAGSLGSLSTPVRFGTSPGVQQDIKDTSPGSWGTELPEGGLGQKQCTPVTPTPTPECGSTPLALEPADSTVPDSAGTAVVISQRRRILDDCHDSDDMLKHFQTLRVDLNDCMGRAKQYRIKLGAGLQ